MQTQWGAVSSFTLSRVSITALPVALPIASLAKAASLSAEKGTEKRRKAFFSRARSISASMSFQT